MSVASVRYTARVAASFVFSCFICGSPTVSIAAPFPDPGFGIEGIVRIGDALTPLLPTSAVALMDGRVVASALSPLGAAMQTVLMRLTANGVPDPTFGSAGRTQLFEPAYCVRSLWTVRRFDESVGVLSSSSADPSCVGGQTIQGAAVSAGGQRDARFAVSGLPQAGAPRPLSVSRDKNDRLYVAGTGEEGSSGYTFVAQLTNHGAADPAFGGGPVKLESGPIASNRSAAVATLDDGTVRTASLAGKAIVFSHFDAQGRVLPAPNGAAAVIVDLQLFFPSASDVLHLVSFLRLSDGANLAILKMIGPAKTSLLIIRAASDFSSYGTSRLIDSAPTSDWPAAVALPDGTVVLAELTGTGAGRQAMLRRMFPNSSFDATWGAGRAFPLGAMTNLTDLELDSGARLLITGSDNAGGFVKRYKLVPDPFFETGAVVEFFNDDLNHFFITANPAEVAAIGAGSAGPGWARTSNGFRVYTDALGVPEGTIRVCRFYGNGEINPVTGQRYGPNSHVYVLDGPECDAVRRDRGWLFEQYAFYVFPSVNGQCGFGQLPVYRAYNGRFVQNDSNHRFTTNQSIYQSMLNAGWRGEGVVMCAPQQ